MSWASWWLTLCGVAAVATVIAALLHELTHAVAARVIGGDIERVGMTRLGPFVEWREPADCDVAAVRFVQLAPAIIGWGSMAAVLAIRGWPSLSIPSALGLWMWAIYTLGGGIEDYSLSRSRQETAQ